MPAAKPVWDGSNWDAGYVKETPSGRPYFRVKRPDYPKCDRRGMAKRSHVVWWLNTGQVVPEGYDIHHDNDDSLDDDFSNLKLLLHGDHSRHTRLLPKVDRVCETCGKGFQALARSVEMGNGKYCSHPCFAARVITQEQRKKMSDGVRQAFELVSLETRRGY